MQIMQRPYYLDVKVKCNKYYLLNNRYYNKYFSFSYNTCTCTLHFAKRKDFMFLNDLLHLKQVRLWYFSLGERSTNSHTPYWLNRDIFVTYEVLHECVIREFIDRGKINTTSHCLVWHVLNFTFLCQ